MPSFSISLNSVLSAINSRSLLSALSSLIYPTYGIYYAVDEGQNKANDSALNFSSVISFNCSGASAITTAPVASQNGMAGNYSSVNKVNQPITIKMRVAVEGLTGFSGQIPQIPSIQILNTDNFNIMKDSRYDVINKLEEMKSKATVYNIETPDKVYPNFDLMDYAFVMNAQSGVTLLAIDLTFQEIRTIQEVSISESDVKETSTTTVSDNKEVTPQ